MEAAAGFSGLGVDNLEAVGQQHLANQGPSVVNYTAVAILEGESETEQGTNL